MKPLTSSVALLLLPTVALALGTLEVPHERISGIAVIAGWKCPPVGNLTVKFDSDAPIPLVKGVLRPDTADVCDNGGSNGFLAEYNYAILGDGHHVAHVYDDGVEFDTKEFDVKTLGQPFRPGLSGSTSYVGFPGIGEITTLTWNEGLQGFVMTDLEDPGQIFHDNFEGGIGLWSVDNGGWEVGLATYGPSGCHQGNACAATVLAGDAPREFYGHLISPSITLPQLGAGEELQLRFWEWHSWAYYSGHGQIDVQEYDSQTGTWTAWMPVPGSDTGAGPSVVWALKSVDLQAHAGQRIRLGFLGQSTVYYPGPGWYIDEVDVIKVP